MRAAPLLVSCLLLVAGAASCGPSTPPGSPHFGQSRPALGGEAGADGAGRATPESLGDGFLLRCDDGSGARTGERDAPSPLFAIGAPRRPAEDRTRAIVRRYRARAPDGAAALPASVALALDAGSVDLESCLENERDEREVNLTIAVDPEGQVVSVSAATDRGRLQRCLMLRLCGLRGAPSAGATKAVIPLAIKEIVALDGVAVADLPAVVVVSGSADQDPSPLGNAMVSLMTQAAAVCRRAPLAAPGANATFEIGLTPHTTVPPTLYFGEITRGDPAPDAALLACVTESLSGRRMPGLSRSGALKVRVTWDP